MKTNKKIMLCIGEMYDMQKSNHSERNKKYRRLLLKKSQKDTIKQLDKE